LLCTILKLVDYYDAANHKKIPINFVVYIKLVIFAPKLINDCMRTILQTEEFEKFYESLNPKIKSKFDYTIDIVKNVYNLPVKYVKHLEGTDLYEMRVSVGHNEYRTILFAIDNQNVILSTRIILLNGFLKKATKDYQRQIEKAERILNSLSI
jgi:hypothetical protein